MYDNSAIEEALELFAEGFSCSQAVLCACGACFGLDRNTALRTAGAFGGGMAGMGETCGVVTGAMMVIGMRYAMTRASGEVAKLRTYATVHEFVRRFKERNGSIVCRELIGVNMSTPEGLMKSRGEGIVKKRCPKYVVDSIEIVQELTA